MNEKMPDKCYFCSSPGITRLTIKINSSCVRYHCQKCGDLEITDQAYLYYLRPDVEKKLSEDDLKKLSEASRKWKEDRPYLVTTKIIKDVTGKKSINYRD